MLLHLHVNLNTDDDDDNDGDDDDDYHILSNEAVIHDVLDSIFNIFCVEASKGYGEILQPATPYFCRFQKIMSVII